MDKRFTLEDQIDMLASALKGRVLAPAHADYDKVRTVALGNFDKRPAAVIRVANAADVAAVLNFAQATELEVAVRSGGHSTSGDSSSDGGLVIDLRDLNRIDIDVEGRTVWAGAGLMVGEVTAAVERHGLIVGFGDSARVGIGGLTLGGGIGYLIRKHGLTIDSLLAAEVVTVGGDILIADEAHHPDLFWALRGGGGNFGVVTRLKYHLHSLPAFTGGPLVLPATPEVVAGFAAAADAAPEELSAIGLIMTAPPMPFLSPELHGKLVFLAMMAFAGEADAAQLALAPFRALATPYADLVRPCSYSSLYILEPPPEVRPTVSIRNGFMNSIGRTEAARMIEMLERSDAPAKMAQVRVLGGAAARVPAGATAFAHRDSRILVTFLAVHSGGPVAAAHDRWASECVTALRQNDPGVYVNFLADEGAERCRAAYPGATWDRLRAIKRRYDPENLFRLNRNIPPA